MMKKIVPDPPLPCTSTRPFGRCDAGHDPLFTVNPNISAEDALVHVALYLRSAYETGYKALDYMREEGRGMFWSNLHAIEMAEGVVEAILDGIESTPPPTNRPHSHSAAFRADAAPVGAGAPANTGKAGAIHRGGFFAGRACPLPQGTCVAQGMSTVDPTVRRADSSACALAASLSGYLCWISTTSLPLPIIANRSSAMAWVFSALLA